MSSGEENLSESPTMQFLDQEPRPHGQLSVSAPSTAYFASNPPSTPSQAPIAPNPPPSQALIAPNPPPPPVPQPRASSPFQARPTFTSPQPPPPPPPPPPPQVFANYQDNDSYFNSFPPGYRFCPHDHELLLYYLDKKVKGLPLPLNRIVNVDLYQFDPEVLSAQYNNHGEKAWYFFTPRNRKYRNGTRPNRAAGGGYWKATGADKKVTYDKPVIGADNTITYQKTLAGHKKALVYYNGKPPRGEKTNWIMHEFRLDDLPRVRNNRDDMRLDDCVLCRIYKKHKKRTNANTNVRAQQGNEEGSLLTVDGNDVDYINEYGYDPNHLSAIEPSFAGETYDMVTNPLENSFPILDDLMSQQQTHPSGFPDANNFYMFQDSQITGLEEAFGTPAPMDFIDTEEYWPYRQMEHRDEFLMSPANSSQYYNIPDQFLNLYPIMPTNLPTNPSPLYNIFPVNTAPANGSLPPMSTAPLTAPPRPANPASSHPTSEMMNGAPSHPTSEMMNGAPSHPGQPPQHR